MKYPKPGEWIYCEKLGREITAIPSNVEMGCAVGKATCLFEGVHADLCAVGNECGGGGGVEGPVVIYVDRGTWPIARLTR